MHTDDHILESVLAAKHPLPALAAHLGMTLIALVKWMDTNANLLAAAKRALESHIAFLSLHAEAAAIIDLTKVSSSTQNEERKRMSASQLLRHTAKRLVTAVGAPPSFSPPRGEKCPSEARAMRGRANAPSTTEASLTNLVASGIPPVPPSSKDVPASTNPERNLRVPSASGSPGDVQDQPATLALHVPLDASMPSALMPSSSAPSPRPSGENYPSTEGAWGMRGGATAPDVATSSLDASMPLAVMPSSLSNAECPMSNAVPFSDHEIDVLMVTLARHFNIDLTSDDAKPEPDSVASNAGPA